jgi:hypothetical protein
MISCCEIAQRDTYATLRRAVSRHINGHSEQGTYQSVTFAPSHSGQHATAGCYVEVGDSSMLLDVLVAKVDDCLTTKEPFTVG